MSGFVPEWIGCLYLSELEASAKIKNQEGIVGII